jgi:FixJ family two-component response regulator
MAHPISVIAVVDDDNRVLESLESLLESNGYSVRLFAAAHELLSSKELDHVDCLITDIGMPEVSGLELLALVRESHSEVPVILITGRPTTEVEQYYLEKGAHAFFQKPFDGRVLLRALQKALQVTSSRSSAIQS